MEHVFPTYDDTLRRTITRLCRESEDGGTTMEEIAKAYLALPPRAPCTPAWTI